MKKSKIEKKKTKQHIRTMTCTVSVVQINQKQRITTGDIK